MIDILDAGDLMVRLLIEFIFYATMVLVFDMILKLAGDAYPLLVLYAF